MSKKFQIGYTYSIALDALFKLKTVKSKNIQQVIGANQVSFTPVGESDRVQQEFVVTYKDLPNLLTSAEWYMVGRIAQELKYGNFLWYCLPEYKKSSHDRTLLAGLKKPVEKDGKVIRDAILIPTETTDIYIVNPKYLRRGDFIYVLAATAELIMDSPRVTKDHIKNIYKVKGESTVEISPSMSQSIASNPITKTLMLDSIQ